jgi:hypothetical protein
MCSTFTPVLHLFAAHFTTYCWSHSFTTQDLIAGRVPLTLVPAFFMFLQVRKFFPKLFLGSRVVRVTVGDEREYVVL